MFILFLNINLSEILDVKLGLIKFYSKACIFDKQKIYESGKLDLVPTIGAGVLIISPMD